MTRLMKSFSLVAPTPSAAETWLSTLRTGLVGSTSTCWPGSGEKEPSPLNTTISPRRMSRKSYTSLLTSTRSWIASVCSIEPGRDEERLDEERLDEQGQPERDDHEERQLAEEAARGAARRRGHGGGLVDRGVGVSGSRVGRLVVAAHHADPNGAAPAGVPERVEPRTTTPRPREGRGVGRTCEEERERTGQAFLAAFAGTLSRFSLILAFLPRSSRR